MDGATPHSIPLVYEKDIPKVGTKYDNTDTLSDPVVAADSGKVCSHVFFSGNLFDVNHQTVVVMLVLVL